MKLLIASAVLGFCSALLVPESRGDSLLSRPQHFSDKIIESCEEYPYQEPVWQSPEMFPDDPPIAALHPTALCVANIEKKHPPFMHVEEGDEHWAFGNVQHEPSNYETVFEEYYSLSAKDHRATLSSMGLAEFTLPSNSHDVEVDAWVTVKHTGSVRSDSWWDTDFWHYLSILTTDFNGNLNKEEWFTVRPPTATFTQQLVDILPSTPEGEGVAYLNPQPYTGDWRHIRFRFRTRADTIPRVQFIMNNWIWARGATASGMSKFTLSGLFYRITEL